MSEFRKGFAFAKHKLLTVNWVSLKTSFVIPEISPTTNLGDRLHRESAVEFYRRQKTADTR